MNFALTTPIITDQKDYERIVAGNATRIVSVTRFSRKTARLRTAGFMAHEIAAPAILPPNIEVMLAPPTAVVDYTNSRERFGLVETSTWQGGMLVRLTLSGDPAVAIREGYRYLFQLQRERRLKPLRFVNYTRAPSVLDAARFAAWEEGGPVGDDEYLGFGRAGGTTWGPLAPATADVTVQQGPPVIEAWFVPWEDHWVRYLRHSEWRSTHGESEIAGRGTCFEIPGGSGMIISSTASRAVLERSRQTAVGGVHDQVVASCDAVVYAMSAASLREARIIHRFAPTDLRAIRVFLRHPEDIRVAREVVERRFGDTPALFIHADPRGGLLVQIDGIVWKQTR